jgi:hypothetical protein
MLARTLSPDGNAMSQTKVIAWGCESGFIQTARKPRLSASVCGNGSAVLVVDACVSNQTNEEKRLQAFFVPSKRYLQ